MDAMGRHPENRTAFKCQGCANSKEIFHPLRRLEAAMREQSVIRHADSQAACHPPQEDRDQQSFPCEKEESRDGSDVKGRHEGGSDPIDLVLASLCSFQILQLHW